MKKIMAAFSFLGTNVTCHNSWDSFFNNPVVTGYLAIIEGQIRNSYLQNKITPQPSDIFKVFQMDLNKCKVVILGEDPYPQKDIATGRAFEVNGITCWSQLNKTGQSSLRNILKLLHKNKFKCLTVEDIKVVRNEFKSRRFRILKPHRLFVNWQRQGVLLLNAALTCQINKSSSHIKYWNDFTLKLIEFIDVNNRQVKWFLWGKKSQKFKKLISNLNNVHESNHPCLNGNSKESFYQKNNFSNVNIIKWYGI
jgi:uracil-DNA glycosylase